MTYNATVDTVAGLLVRGFKSCPRELPPGHDWTRYSRFAVPTVDLRRLNRNISDITDKAVFALEGYHGVEDCLTDVIGCDLVNIKRTLSLMHRCINDDPGAGSVALFNGSNTDSDCRKSPPALLVFHRNIPSLALWSDARVRKGFVLYSIAGGHLIGRECDLRKMRPKVTRRSSTPPSLSEATRRFFHSAVLRYEAIEKALRETILDESTHYLSQQEDGSLLVRSRKMNWLDNPHGPAVITPVGDTLYFLREVPVSEKAAMRSRRFRRNASSPISVEEYRKKPGR